MRDSIWVLALVVGWTTLACRPGASRPFAPPATPQVDEGTGDRSFVVFTQAKATIDQLEEAIRPPVAVGSRPGPGTLSSDDPAIVSIGPTGDLIGHRYGQTTIRTLNGEGSMLLVEVAEARPIRLRPAELELRPGEEAGIEVVDASGAPIPAAKVQWGTSSPRRAHVLGGRVVAGPGAGDAKVLARFGSRTAEANVLVRTGPAKTLHVLPKQARLRAGGVKLFQAAGAAGPLAAAWRSSDESVIQPMQGGLFLARAAGVAEVCVVALGSATCARVEVIP